MNTRGYHGLLVGALTPPVGRTLMLAGLIETVVTSGGEVSLSTIRWHDGTVAPAGWTRLEAVEFEGTVPTWRFRGPGFTLAKTVFMDHGANVARVEYLVVDADEPLTLRLEVLTDFRDYHSRSFAGGPVPEVRADGDSLVVVGPGGPGTDLHLVCGGGDAAVRAEPYRAFDLAKERERGLTDTEDHLLAGVFTRVLAPGEAVQLVASAGRRVAPDPMARAAALARKSELISRFRGVGMPAALDGAGKGANGRPCPLRNGGASRAARLGGALASPPTSSSSGRRTDDGSRRAQRDRRLSLVRRLGPGHDDRLPGPDARHRPAGDRRAAILRTFAR